MTKTIVYDDPSDGFRGYLAFCGDGHRLAAGGLRVQLGLNAERIGALAEAMYLKQRLLGLSVDGAKAGIALDPSAPAKAESLGRFLRFLRPHLLERLSLGPDLGTQWDEIERLARQEHVPSVKFAVAGAQGLDEAEFHDRIRVLNEVVDGRTVGQRRAGHALAHAALGAARAVGGNQGALRVGIQGFGTLGRGAAQSLAGAGARVIAVADIDGCVVSEDGLNVGAMLKTPRGQSILSHAGGNLVAAPRDAIFEQRLDVVVLAACEDAVSDAQAAAVDVRAVVVGANLGVSADNENLLHRRGVLVIPDFVAGCGGSASMDALFGPSHCPSGRSVLDHVGSRMCGLVAEVVARVRHRDVAPRQAAIELCDLRADTTGGRPYGAWRPAPLVSAEHG